MTEHMPINALCNCSSPLLIHPYPRKRSPAGRICDKSMTNFLAGYLPEMSLPTALAHALALSPICKIQVFSDDSQVSVLRSAPPLMVRVERITCISSIGRINPFKTPACGLNPTPQL